MAIVLIGAAIDLLREVVDQTLDQGGETEDMVERRGHVADTDLDRAEVVVRPDIPPDLADRLDEAGLDHVVEEPGVFGPVPHQRRKSRGGQGFHHLDPLGVEARIPPLPERAVDRERQ